MLIPDGQNDLADALPVEVDLRSWRIIRTLHARKGLTAMVNQTSPPTMVDEMHLHLAAPPERKGRGTCARAFLKLALNQAVTAARSLRLVRPSGVQAPH